MLTLLNFIFRKFRRQRSPDGDCEMAEREQGKSVKKEPKEPDFDTEDLVRKTSELKVGDAISNKSPRPPIPPEVLW